MGEMKIGPDSHSDSPKGKESKCDNLMSQVALDLAKYLDNFPNKTFAIRVVAKETGLNPKTIRRLLARANKPTHQTLYKLYSIFFEEDNYSRLLERCPQVVKERICDYNPCDQSHKEKDNKDFLDHLKREPLMAELFVLAGTGPLNRNAVAFRYGQYGLEVLEKLLTCDLLVEVDKETFELSKNSPTLDGHALKYLGEYFIRRFSKADNTQVHNENIINFYAEGLNEDGKKAWLKVDTEAFYKKVEIAKDPKYSGKIPVFTFTATDTITPEKKND